MSTEALCKLYILNPDGTYLSVQVRRPAPRFTPKIGEGYGVLALVRPDDSVEYLPPLC